MERNYRKRKSKKGFTLVELLIVVAIIGILCVLALPALMGSITKAKKARVLTNSRGIYTTILSEMAAHSCDEITKEEITKLSQVPGKILDMKFTDEELDTLLYQEEDLIAKYENKKWSVGTESSQEVNYFGGSYTMEAIRTALATCDKERLGSMSGNGVAELKDANIDLEKNGIKTWYYDKSRGLLALSPQYFNDGQERVYTHKPFVLYNYNSKKYEVKNVWVETQNSMLNLDKNHVKDIAGGGTFDNYEDALSAWEKITK